MSGPQQPEGGHDGATCILSARDHPLCPTRK